MTPRGTLFIVSGPSGAGKTTLSNAALHWMPDADAVCRNVRAALVRGGRFVAELGGQGNVSALRAAMVSSGLWWARAGRPRRNRRRTGRGFLSNPLSI